MHGTAAASSASAASADPEDVLEALRGAVTLAGTVHAALQAMADRHAELGNFASHIGTICNILAALVASALQPSKAAGPAVTYIFTLLTSMSSKLRVYGTLPALLKRSDEQVRFCEAASFLHTSLQVPGPLSR